MRNLFLALLSMLALTVSAVSRAQDANAKIGIFDLAAIHSWPLNAQVTNRSEAEGGVIVEEVRYDVMPGVRAFAYLTYPKDARNLACNVEIRNEQAEPRVSDAQKGFIGWSVAAPSGNTNPNIRDTVGGAKNSETFTDDYNKSWIYQYVVANIRGLDYLATRPEIDMKRIVVSGFSWSGFITALMHAVDNRPACYVSWNSTGYYADEKGMSGDVTSRVTRKQYEMYCPSAYAQYGTQPIFIGNSITDYFATLDGAMEMYDKLKCPKQFAWAPNRYHEATSRKEYDGGGAYMWQFQGNGPKTTSVLDGTFAAQNGKLYYKYFLDAHETPTRTEVLYSYGAPGHWMGRTWHRAVATLDPKEGYVAEIPVYDPNVPVYACGQIEGPVSNVVGNRPRVYIPKDGGIPQATAEFPTTLLDFEDQSDLYIGRGATTIVGDAYEGQYAAQILPFRDGTVHVMNIEPFLWKGAKELHFFLKGDGKQGPIRLYLMRGSDYYFDPELFKGHYSTLTIADENETLTPGWHEYSIPLDKIPDKDKVDSLWFSLPSKEHDRTLTIDGVHLEPSNNLTALHDTATAGASVGATGTDTSAGPGNGTPVNTIPTNTTPVNTTPVNSNPPKAVAKWGVKIDGTKLGSSDAVASSGATLGDDALTLSGGRLTLSDAKQKALDAQLAGKPLTLFFTVMDDGGPDSTVFTFGDLRLTMKDKGWYLVYNPTGEWHQVDLGIATKGVPVHIAMIAQDGLARIYLEGKEIGKFPFKPSDKQPLTLGSPQAEATSFKGQLSGFDIVPQALTTDLIAKRFEDTSGGSSSGTTTTTTQQPTTANQGPTNPPVTPVNNPPTTPNNAEQTKTVVVQVELTDFTKVPEPNAILPYRDALITHEYKVISITSGNMSSVKVGGLIRVARWGVVAGKQTALLQLKKGDKLTLTLGKFEDNPTLQHMFTVDDLEPNFSAPYLLDTGSAK